MGASHLLRQIQVFGNNLFAEPNFADWENTYPNAYNVRSLTDVEDDSTLVVFLQNWFSNQNLAFVSKGLNQFDPDMLQHYKSSRPSSHTTDTNIRVLLLQFLYRTKITITGSMLWQLLEEVTNSYNGQLNTTEKKLFVHRIAFILILPQNTRNGMLLELLAETPTDQREEVLNAISEIKGILLLKLKGSNIES